MYLLVIDYSIIIEATNLSFLKLLNYFKPSNIDGAADQKHNTFNNR